MNKNSYIGLKIITKTSISNLPPDLPVKFKFNFNKLNSQLHFLQITNDTMINSKEHIGLYIITNGRGEISSNNEHFKFQSGDIIFVSSGTEHKFLNCDESTQAWAVFGAD